jgi:redox-sensitive bicupin YhaK (pirin superfamily)
MLWTQAPDELAEEESVITVRPAAERGHTDWGWLDSRHTFSFGEYHDPRHMGFRSLRVINDDRVTPGAGFGTHGHRDMEILSYVLEGGLEHKDSTGGGGIIRPGEIQFMRAGTGVTHSEYNGSKAEPVHFLQIWVMPDTRGLAPRYDQKPFDTAAAREGFVLLASRDGRDGSIQVHQDVSLWMARLGEGDERKHALAPGRHAWLHAARGTVTLNGRALEEGDGAAVSEEASVQLVGHGDAEVLLFDLS